MEPNMPKSEQIQMKCEKVESCNGQLVVHLRGDRWWGGIKYTTITTIRTHMDNAEYWIVGKFYDTTIADPNLDN